MRLYAVLERRGDPRSGKASELDLVHEGFCWPALLFGPFWAFAAGMWLTGLVLAALWAALLAGPWFWPPLVAAQPYAVTALALLLGLHGNDLRQRAREAAGYEVIGVVSGSGLVDAERRLFVALGPLYTR
ncbi:MAG: DUF2628 domain-containing protein [Proteobacteria bacterium]|nr:DUF2628 domain-containing protein [Pseudomonadota bacterium]MDA1132091.1 DUF2628 domain-containing protein [Pseudomonadota bacterium]